MYEIEVKVPFRYSHRLSPPYRGKCSNLHSESGTLICIFKSKVLNKYGMIIDFGEVKKKLKEILDKDYDHAFLCKKGDFVGKFLKKHHFRELELEENPTAEYLAKRLCYEIYPFYSQIYKVGLIESFDDSIAWFTMEEEDCEILQNINNEKSNPKIRLRPPKRRKTHRRQIKR